MNFLILWEVLIKKKYLGYYMSILSYKKSNMSYLAIGVSFDKRLIILKKYKDIHIL
jgi:hypothetical protein